MQPTLLASYDFTNSNITYPLRNACKIFLSKDAPIIIEEIEENDNDNDWSDKNGRFEIIECYCNNSACP